MTFRERIIEEARGYYDHNTGKLQPVEFSVSPDSAAELLDAPPPNLPNLVISFLFQTPTGPVRIRVDKNLQPGMIRAERLPNAVTSRAAVQAEDMPR